MKKNKTKKSKAPKLVDVLPFTGVGSKYDKDGSAHTLEIINVQGTDDLYLIWTASELKKMKNLKGFVEYIARSAFAIGNQRGRTQGIQPLKKALKDLLDLG